TAEPSASQPEEPAVEPTTSEPESPLPKGPVLTPEQVWDKLLAMIDAIDQREDLNQQHIEQAIGLTLHQPPGETHAKRAHGDTTAGWGYMFSLSQFTEERSEEHTSELQSRENLVCRLLLDKKNVRQMLHDDRTDEESWS